MSDLLYGFDFSTINAGSMNITPSTVAQLYNQGFRHAWMGYDPSAVSMNIRAMFVNAGFSWSVYRYLYFGMPVAPQIASILQAIHQGPEPLPWWLVLDVEDDPPANDPRSWISQAMDLVEAGDVRPGSRVQPAIYTSPYWYRQYLGNWTEPKDRGWKLLPAEWNHQPDLNVSLFGGFTQNDVIGHQYEGTVASAVGGIDLDVILSQDVQPTTGPVQPGSALTRIKGGQLLRAQASMLENQADSEFAEAAADLES